MNAQKQDILDVLIVGAGPVGLFLANECARRSLRYQIVETRARQSQYSKALAVMPRTLEIFDMAGIARPFAAAANRVTSARLVSQQRDLARLKFMPEESPYPFVGMVPQDVTERLLVEELERKGGRVTYNTTCTGIFEHHDGIAVTLESNGKTSSISAKFVVGCDGAHSAIRHFLDIPFEGAEYDAAFLLADVETDDRLPADEMQLCSHEDGPVVIFPMSATRWRVVATTTQTDGAAPSLDFVRNILARRAPAQMEAKAMRWSSYFRIHHRHASKLRSSRIFIAGDAAHVHSPFGGQGMNTGLQDAWNLIWKIDLALRGFASNALLDTYEAERLPVIKHVIDVTDFITKAMSVPNGFLRGVRDIAVPVISRLAPIQRGFVQTLSELGVNYEGSPIVDGDGERYLDDSMRDGGVSHRFMLFVSNEMRRTEEFSRMTDEYTGVLEKRAASRSGITLVRPDGYVAFHAAQDSDSSMHTIRDVLARQTVNNA